MSNWLIAIILIVAFLIAGTMDYQDAQWAERNNWSQQ